MVIYIKPQNTSQKLSQSVLLMRGDENMKMKIGEKIRALRKGKMTQAELAERVGVHETSIRRWELGNRVPDVKDIQKIAEVLNVPTTELLDDALNISGDTNQNLEQNNNKDGHLVFRDRDRYIDLPDTPDNRTLFRELVLSISTVPAVTA